VRRYNRDEHNAESGAQQEKLANGVDNLIDSYIATSSADLLPW
jgi:hypothetical protein